jgi:hypothetical protein
MACEYSRLGEFVLTADRSKLRRAVSGSNSAWGLGEGLLFSLISSSSFCSLSVRISFR